PRAMRPYTAPTCTPRMTVSSRRYTAGASYRLRRQGGAGGAAGDGPTLCLRQQLVHAVDGGLFRRRVVAYSGGHGCGPCVVEHLRQTGAQTGDGPLDGIALGDVVEPADDVGALVGLDVVIVRRSEERRVGKEW